MGKLWWAALVGTLVALGPAPRLAAQTEPGAPPNGFTDAPSTGPEFVPVTTREALEYYPRCSVTSEMVWYLLRRPEPRFPLATTGDVADQVPGALGQPNTVPTTNSDTFSQGMRLGGKLTANYWLTDQPESLGLQASGFIMRQATSSFVQASAGGTADPVVARPFFNGPLGREDSDPRAIPGALGGNVGIEFQTRMIGAEGSVICNLTGFSPTGPSVFALLGPRFLKFDERYFSNEFTIDLPPTPVNSFLIQDKFTCYNEFLGAQIGAQFRYRWEGVTFDLIGKFAMGRNHETLMIDGQTVITNQVTGARVGGRQGLFAQPSNIGEYTQNSLSMIPELALNLTVDVAPNLKVLFGYGFMYMTNVARPAENLDRNVNIQPLGAPTQIGPPLPLRPTSIAETNLWSNAFSFGVQLVF